MQKETNTIWPFREARIARFSTNKFPLYFSFDKVRDGLKNYQPIGRVGEVEEMAALVAFLISDDNRFMTGSTITSDGGIGVDSRSQS